LTCIHHRLGFRQTDLFEYFKKLKETNQLPAFEDLEALARKLHRAYTSSRAQYRAIHDTQGLNEWSRIIPLGSPWTGLIPEESSANVGIPTRNVKGPKTAFPVQESSANVGASTESGKKKWASEKQKTAADSKNFKGDRVLSQSIALLGDIMWAWECAYAVAEGDAGRVYEVLKVGQISRVFACVVLKAGCR
jgi:hypothetical protein